jgi:hypothetical protein
MARTIRVSDIGDYASQQMEKLLRAAVLETDALVKQASPVKTGRFSASTACITICHMQSLSPMAAASRLLVLKVVKPAGCRVRPKMCRAEY